MVQFENIVLGVIQNVIHIIVINFHSSLIKQSLIINCSLCQSLLAIVESSHKLGSPALSLSFTAGSNYPFSIEHNFQQYKT